LNSERLHAPSRVAGELAEPGTSGALPIGGDHGGIIYPGEGADMQWTPSDPETLRQILAELRQLD
jgi:hypothetical protein